MIVVIEGWGMIVVIEGWGMIVVIDGVRHDSCY